MNDWETLIRPKRVTTDYWCFLTSALLRRSCSRSGLWSLSTSATISWSAYVQQRTSAIWHVQSPVNQPVRCFNIRTTSIIELCYNIVNCSGIEMMMFGTAGIPGRPIYVSYMLLVVYTNWHCALPVSLLTYTFLLIMSFRDFPLGAHQYDMRRYETMIWDGT